MNKIKPYWIDIYIAISKDYDKKEITWKELFEEEFILNTDIYNLMIKTLIYIGIDVNSKIKYKHLLDLSTKFIYSYKIIHENNKDILFIEKKNIKQEINSKGIEKTLDLLGLKKI